MLLAFLACDNTEWLSEQAPYEPEATVMPAPLTTPQSPHSALTSVSVGLQGVCGVREDGSLYCRGMSFRDGATPPQGPFRLVSVGDNDICGVRDDGSVACWGPYELGDTTPPDGSYTSVSVGGIHVCGVRDDGSIACWGSDEYGHVTPPEGSFTSVSVGGNHVCGVREDGSIACGGSDEYDQPTPPEGSFISVSVNGFGHICGVHEDGSIACGGCTVLGENTWSCDDGFADEQATPPEGSFTSVSVGEDIACGLRENKTLACWSLVVDHPSPDDLPPDTFTQGTFISVSVGPGFSEPDVNDGIVDYLTNICAIREDGSAACWGDVPGQMPKPTLSITSRTSDSLTVEWADPDWSDPEWGYNRGPPFYYYYQLHASQSPEGPYNLVMSEVDAGIYVVEGLQPSAVYYLALLTCDDFECSQTMAVATTESDGPVSAPPTPPRFRGKKIVHSGTFAADDAKLNWEPVAGATYYELWKGSDPDLPFELVVQINAPLEAQSFEVAPNRFFGGYDLTSWKVRACNKAGCSPFTDTVTIE